MLENPYSNSQFSSRICLFLSVLGVFADISRGCFPVGQLDGCLAGQNYLVQVLPALQSSLVSADGAACVCSEDLCNDDIEFGGNLDYCFRVHFVFPLNVLTKPK